MKHCASDIIIGIILGCFAFLLLFALVIGIKRCQEQPMPVPAVNRIVSEADKAVMKYHGIDVMFVGHDDRMFFYREGKKVRI